MVLDGVVDADDYATGPVSQDSGLSILQLQRSKTNQIHRVDFKIPQKLTRFLMSSGKDVSKPALMYALWQTARILPMQNVHKRTFGLGLKISTHLHASFKGVSKIPSSLETMFVKPLAS
jgi:hypothetical protein